MVSKKTDGPEPYRAPDGYADAYAVRYVCETCGAGVIDHEKHTAWHQNNHRN